MQVRLHTILNKQHYSCDSQPAFLLREVSGGDVFRYVREAFMGKKFSGGVIFHGKMSSVIFGGCPGWVSAEPHPMHICIASGCIGAPAPPRAVKKM